MPPDTPVAGRTGSGYPVEWCSAAARYSPTAGASVEMTVSERIGKLTPVAGWALAGAGTTVTLSEGSQVATVRAQGFPPWKECRPRGHSIRIAVAGHAQVGQAARG